MPERVAQLHSLRGESGGSRVGVAAAQRPLVPGVRGAPPVAAARIARALDRLVDQSVGARDVTGRDQATRPQHAEVDREQPEAAGVRQLGAAAGLVQRRRAVAGDMCEPRREVGPGEHEPWLSGRRDRVPERDELGACCGGVGGDSAVAAHQRVLIPGRARQPAGSARQHVVQRGQDAGRGDHGREFAVHAAAGLQEVWVSSTRISRARS